jgi:hypothetical protein
MEEHVLFSAMVAKVKKQAKKDFAEKKKRLELERGGNRRQSLNTW